MSTKVTNIAPPAPSTFEALFYDENGRYIGTFVLKATDRVSATREAGPLCDVYHADSFELRETHPKVSR